MIQECKIPSAKPIFMDFAVVTGQVLNSYQKSKEEQNERVGKDL